MSVIRGLSHDALHPAPPRPGRAAGTVDRLQFKSHRATLRTFGLGAAQEAPGFGIRPQSRDSALLQTNVRDSREADKGCTRANFQQEAVEILKQLKADVVATDELLRVRSLLSPVFLFRRASQLTMHAALSTGNQDRRHGQQAEEQRRERGRRLGQGARAEMESRRRSERVQKEWV